MTSENAIDAIEIVLLLLAGIYHFRKIDFKSATAKYSVAVALALPTIGITRSQEFKLFVDTSARLPNLGYLLEYIFCMVLCLSWTIICLYTAGELTEKRERLMLLSGLAVYVAMLAVWVGEVRSGEAVSRYYYDSTYYWVLKLIPNMFFLGAVTAVTIPATFRKFSGRKANIQRIRLVSLVTLQSELAIYVLFTISMALLKLGNQIPDDYDSPARNTLHILMILTYIASILSDDFYLRLIDSLDGIADPKRVKRLQLVDAHVAGLLEKKPQVVAYPADPERTVTEGFLKIINLRRLLTLHPSFDAQLTGHKIETLCAEHSDHLKIIDELAKWIKRTTKK